MPSVHQQDEEEEEEEEVEEGGGGGEREGGRARQIQSRGQRRKKKRRRKKRRRKRAPPPAPPAPPPAPPPPVRGGRGAAAPSALPPAPRRGTRFVRCVGAEIHGTHPGPGSPRPTRTPGHPSWTWAAPLAFPVPWPCRSFLVLGQEGPQTDRLPRAFVQRRHLGGVALLACGVPPPPTHLACLRVNEG